MNIRRESWPIFTYSTGLKRPGCLCLSLAAVQQVGTLMTVGFLGQSTARVNALQLALQTVSGATVLSIHAYDGLLDWSDRTASQVTLASRTNCFAGQALLLETDYFDDYCTVTFLSCMTHLCSSGSLVPLTHATYVRPTCARER